MAVNPGEEFRIRATPDAETRRKLQYLAEIGSDSILSGHAAQRGALAAERDKRPSDSLHNVSQLLEQQRQQAQRIAAINSRLEALDRASLEALREAEERMDDIMLNANRAIDGRVIFMDDDGTIRDEHGGEVSPGDINADTWRPEAPSWAEFVGGVKGVDDARVRHQKVQDLKGRLGNDPTDEDLSLIDDEIEALEAAMPDSVATEYAEQYRSTSAAKRYDGETSASGMALRDSFGSAVTPDNPGDDTAAPAVAPLKPAAPI